MDPTQRPPFHPPLTQQMNGMSIRGDIRPASSWQQPMTGTAGVPSMSSSQPQGHMTVQRPQVPLNAPQQLARNPAANTQQYPMPSQTIPSNVDQISRLGQQSSARQDSAKLIPPMGRNTGFPPTPQSFVPNLQNLPIPAAQMPHSLTPPIGPPQTIRPMPHPGGQISPPNTIRAPALPNFMGHPPTQSSAIPQARPISLNPASAAQNMVRHPPLPNFNLPPGPAQISPAMGHQPGSVQHPPPFPSASIGPPHFTPADKRNSSFDSSSKTKIDPSQIPSAIQVAEQDLHSFQNSVYVTSSHIVPPIFSSRVPCVDDGVAAPCFVRSTLYNIPCSSELLDQTKIPFALVIQPFAKSNLPVPVIDVTESGPIRCNRCQGYLNSLCRFIDGGKSFICNLCTATNEVSNEYFCNLDFNGKRTDVDSRPELKYGSVDFIVSKEYVLHPLHRPCIVFAIDCSTAAQRSGAFVQSIESIKECLNTPSFSKMYAKIGILTFDRTIQFYDLRDSLNVPHVMVVSEVDDPFVPLEKGFFCDINKSRNLILALLDQLPSLYASSSVAGSVLGSAVKVAANALKECGGGRVVLLQSILPDHGAGVLSNRENPSLAGTEKEVSLFNGQDDFYKNMAEECCVNGVCVSIFSMSTGYVDAATIGFLATWTGGDFIHYPHFSGEKNGFQFVKDVAQSVSKPFVFDVIGRIRTSNSVRVSQYYGNLGMRNALDMEFGALDSSHAIAISFEHENKLDEKEVVYFQIALLHTTDAAERRVRVHNFAVPVTSTLANVYRCASLETTIAFLSKHAASQALVSPIKDIKAALIKNATRTLSTYRKQCASSTSPGQLILPDSFKLLPVFILSMLKSKAFRSSVPADERMAMFHALRSMSVEKCRYFYYPNLYPLHPLLEQPEEQQSAPSPLRLLASSLDPQGIYLLENGIEGYIWIGRHCPQHILQQLYSTSELGGINVNLPELPVLNTKLSVRIRTFIQYIRSQKDDFFALRTVRQGIDPWESEFMSHMVEDANNGHPSHVDFLCELHSDIQKLDKK